MSEDAVVDAALAVLQADGLEAVTMRRVAAALDTGAASLYVYVAGREGLLQAMLDRVAASVQPEAPDPARWREQLHDLLDRIHRALRAHPGIAALTLADRPTSDGVLRMTESLLGILLAGGVAGQDAAWACDVLISLVTAVASEEDVRNAHGPLDEVGYAQGIFQTFATLPAEHFPLLRAHADQMVAGDSDERFRFAIDVVLDGLLARATDR